MRAHIQMLCETKQIDQAFDLFSQSPDPYAASSLIAAYSKQQGNLDKAVAVYKLLSEHSSGSPDTGVIGSLVSACRRAGQPGRTLHLVLNDIDRFGLDLDNTTAHILIAACGDSGDTASARRMLTILQRPMRTTVKVDAVDCGQLCKALLAGGDIKGALDLLESMESKWGIQPSPQSCTLMLTVCGNKGDPCSGKRIHNLIEKRGIVINSHVATALITMYSKCNQPHESVAVFDQYKQRTTPDVIVWTALINTYVRHKQPFKAFASFAEMLRTDVRPNGVTFCVLLSACGEIGALAKGRELHGLIKKQRIRTDDNLASALIAMYGRTGSLKDASIVFDEVRNNPQSVGAWTAMIGTYGDHRCVEKALALFDQMTGNPGPKPNSLTLTVVLTTCSHAGLIDKALEIVVSMKERWGIVPDLIHHNCVIDTLGRTGRLEEAEEYLMRNNCAQDPTAWLTLLGACRKFGDVERGERAEESIRKLNPGAAASRVLLANIYGVAQRLEDKVQVWEQMAKDGVHKIPGKSCIEVGGRVHEFRVADTIHPHAEQIISYLDQLWMRMKQCGYVPLTHDVTHHNMTHEEKDVHLCHHSEKLAIAYGLMKTPEGTPLTITKNLRVCPDCHQATGFIAKMTQREIQVRDANCWHKFDPHTGKCSCNEYW